MGRRRRRVIRIPKKRLPKFFDCPECGKPGTIRIHISPKEPVIIAKCGECGGESRKKLTKDKDIKLECLNEKCEYYKQEILRVRLLESSRLGLICGRCHKRNFLEIPIKDYTTFNCSCELSKQGNLKTRQAEKFAEVMCGNCGLKKFFSDLKPTDERVDIYGRFLDVYYGKE